MEYPIKRLNPNITQFLNKVISADVLGAIQTGLRNEIELIDDGGHITDFASITFNPLTHQSEVRLSMAYCQYLWLICDVALKVLDRNVIVANCALAEITLDQYLQSTEEARKMSAEQVAPLLPEPLRARVDAFLAYLALVPDLLREDFWQQMKDEYAAAMSIVCHGEPIYEEVIGKLDINGLYSERVNSVYCYGIAFLLLHEQAHHSLQHLQRHTDEQDELNADSSAFWSIFNDISGDNRISANAGMLCVFFSFLMFDPEQKLVEDHPTDYKRLFTIYDEIKDEHPKYTQLLKGLLDFWASVNAVDDYPFGLSESEETIEQIHQFLETKYNICT